MHYRSRNINKKRKINTLWTILISIVTCGIMLAGAIYINKYVSPKHSSTNQVPKCTDTVKIIRTNTMKQIDIQLIGVNSLLDDLIVERTKELGDVIIKMANNSKYPILQKMELIGKKPKLDILFPPDIAHSILSINWVTGEIETEDGQTGTYVSQILDMLNIDTIKQLPQTIQPPKSQKEEVKRQFEEAINALENDTTVKVIINPNKDTTTFKPIEQ